METFHVEERAVGRRVDVSRNQYYTRKSKEIMGGECIPDCHARKGLS